MIRARRATVRGWLGRLLLVVPLFTAVFGPLFAGSLRSESGPLLPASGTHPLGTDVLGRDVLSLVLQGGASILALAGSALLLSYVVGVPLALAVAGTYRRWLDETLLRGMDLLLSMPGLLVLLVLAASGRRDIGTLVLAVAVLQLPAVVRLVRSAALAPGCQSVVETMILQGESWWTIHIGHVGRATLRHVVVDAGSRLSLVLYLLASANYLGLGLISSSSDWAVLIERNREALFIQPLAVLAPAALLVALCTGINLVTDQLLARRRWPT